MKPPASSRTSRNPESKRGAGKASSTPSIEPPKTDLAEKYHVALSFADEDRKYVEVVATKLRDSGVVVFYDKFEETTLWGKDLYSYLSNIYQNRALYTIIFVSKAYEEKHWPNLERRAAQARAISESREYILPAIFDDTVEIPGLLRTTGYIDLKGLNPEEFADKILKKLRDDGVFLGAEEKFAYSSEAKADIDFQLSGRSRVVEIIKGLKSHDWYKQRPAMETLSSLDWTDVTQDQAFVLGRNIYQCACGAERTAEAFWGNLRQELAQISPDAATHLLNGMFYEVYFSSKGEFREDNLKTQRMNELFAIQAVEKYRDSIAFIRRALSPYRNSLVVLPSTTPEVVTLTVRVAKKDPPFIQNIKCFGQELLVDIREDFGPTVDRMWRLALKRFRPWTLEASIAEAWYVPKGQVRIEFDPAMPDDVLLSLPKGKTISRPCR